MPKQDGDQLHIRVEGLPKPKGSVSAFPINRKGGGTGVTVVHSKASKHWETLVRDACYSRGTIAGPVEVEILFHLPKPNVKRLFPEVYPDIDKLARATLDALQHGVIDDDKRVCDLIVRKRYAGGTFIGADITIRQLKDSEV